ncbi:MAG: hypothetical protein NT162_03815, partial [Candidatus Woesebacteria bacterium]|nr:hypothetical protein [Candidatus Woesebacteria bacterium]
MPTAQKTPVSNGTGGTLADILVDLGALDKTRADQIKLTEIQSGSTQEDIITKSRLVPEEKLIVAKAKLYNIPYVDLAKAPVAPAALSTLPSEVAERFKVFPISIDRSDKSLILAMADPMDISAIEFIEQKTGLRIKPVAAQPSEIDNFIQTRYTTSLTQEVTAALKEAAPDKEVIMNLQAGKGEF